MDSVAIVCAIRANGPSCIRAIPTYDRVGGPSVVTIQSMLTAKCTAARSSFALALSAENRSGTGPANRQLQERSAA
jgi:spore coat protein U-like protein